MFRITKNFHIIHMSDDLAELDAWYDDVFAVNRWMDNHYSDFLKRYGSLVLIGDLCIEPMQPAFEDEGWDQVAIGKFWHRFHKRLHSIAWYVESRDDIVEMFGRLVANDVRIYSGGGVKAPTEPPPGPLFTHPRDTFTQLEFMVPMPDSPFPDPRHSPGFDPSFWAREHPLHLLKSAYITLSVHDVEEGKRVYADVFGGRLLHEEERPLLRTRSAFVAVGEDLVIELAQPLDEASPLVPDMDVFGQSLYGIGLLVADLGDAERYLEEKGITAAYRDDTTLVADPTTTHGGQYVFTTWEVPNDPRPRWG